jgi:uncharacterized protein YqgC (DUF456 family)
MGAQICPAVALVPGDVGRQQRERNEKRQRVDAITGWLVLQWIAYVVIGVGLLGAILPVLPGPILIWLGALLWAWADHFQRVGWPTLIVLALLGVASAASDIWMSALGARKGGASWQALLAGTGLGVLGFVLFSLPGGIAGVVLGILGVETWRAGGLTPALKSSAGFLVGYILSAAVQVSLSLIMVAIFAWQALGTP